MATLATSAVAGDEPVRRIAIAKLAPALASMYSSRLQQGNRRIPKIPRETGFTGENRKPQHGP